MEHITKTVKYEFEWVAKRQLKNDIIVFDDYTMSQFNEIVQLVNEIEKKLYFKKIHSDPKSLRNCIQVIKKILPHFFLLECL